MCQHPLVIVVEGISSDKALIDLGSDIMAPMDLCRAALARLSRACPALRLAL